MAYKINDLLPLPNSTERIPRIGFGVYRSPSHQCVKSVHKALEVGYRHIDTAQFYGNEAEVGEALRSSNLSREEVFVTSKILSPAGSPEATYEKLLESVEKIGGPGGYVDLFLIHSSKSGSAGRKHLWQALEKLQAEGKAKSIGVSNFGVHQIEEMKSYAKVWPPQVNQIEVCISHSFHLVICLVCFISTWIRCADSCLSSSSTLGASNAQSMHTARRMESSLRHTRPLCETIKRMTPRWSRWRRNTARQLNRS